MDITTLMGIVLGAGLIIWGIVTSGDLGNYVDVASIILVIGGTITAVLASYPMEKLKKTLTITKIAFQNRSHSPTNIMKEIIELSSVARRDGLLALEEAGNKAEDEFLKKGIMLIVDGTDPELVRNIMETELTFLEERHADGRGLFDSIATFAPAFGMIGTLIGLINMLQGLDDPSTVGPQMSVALITTFYGSVLANAFGMPISAKLKVKSKQEILMKELIVEGLLSIQAGENPRIIEEKLKTFIPPELRSEMGNSGEGE
ncbi:chemotaxis protein PomA [Andreesenia angusta]|uniref:Chemotaxis protein PomA n=1 Tax=Andreesenia angusta TaxID=39480 RepID=A0A1S1V8N0_9FIRM|nr:MotA/TolQ/ExbB proton channel family protein [Andreesenia angusta]OHW62765.1 chemotaxis protein PomA [Andreesenia angusta]